jgi:hypothetical protein
MLCYVMLNCIIETIKVTDGRMRPMGSKLASRGLDSRQPVTEEIRFRIRARPCKITGGQSVSETGFFLE